MASAADQIERALDFCDRALAQLRALDQPLRETAVHQVIPLVEAARIELIAILNDDRASARRTHRTHHL
jgi:hypothetical protein